MSREACRVESKTILALASLVDALFLVAATPALAVYSDGGFTCSGAPFDRWCYDDGPNGGYETYDHSAPPGYHNWMRTQVQNQQSNYEVDAWQGMWPYLCLGSSSCSYNIYAGPWKLQPWQAKVVCAEPSGYTRCWPRLAKATTRSPTFGDTQMIRSPAANASRLAATLLATAALTGGAFAGFGGASNDPTAPSYFAALRRPLNATDRGLAADAGFQRFAHAMPSQYRAEPDQARLVSNTNGVQVTLMPTADGGFCETVAISGSAGAGRYKSAQCSYGPRTTPGSTTAR